MVNIIQSDLKRLRERRGLTLYEAVARVNATRRVRTTPQALSDVEDGAPCGAALLLELRGLYATAR